MPLFRWLSYFREDPKQARREMFLLGQGVEAEAHEAELLEDLAEVGKKKLGVLADIDEQVRRFEDGPQIVREAAEAFREGLAEVLALPAHVLLDREARPEVLDRPFDGSTASRPPSAPGSPAKADPARPLDGAGGPRTPSSNGSGESSATPPPRKRGRPPGSRNKPKGGGCPPSPPASS